MNSKKFRQRLLETKNLGILISFYDGRSKSVDTGDNSDRF